MTYFDYVAGITLGALAATVITDFNAQFGPLALSFILWAFYALIMGYISLKSRKIRKFVEGEPTLLIQNGKILEDNMGKVRLNADDLLKLLREKQVANLADVEFGLL